MNHQHRPVCMSHDTLRDTSDEVMVLNRARLTPDENEVKGTGAGFLEDGIRHSTTAHLYSFAIEIKRL